MCISLDELSSFFTVRKGVGACAVPDYNHHVPGLPETRFGKIVRRILRKLVAVEDDLGDFTTSADPAVVDVIRGALVL